MSIRTRVFLVFLALIVVGIGILVNWMQGEMRPRYMEAQEEILVDFSQLLAAILGSKGVRLVDGAAVIDAAFLEDSFHQLARRDIAARIYRLEKHYVDIRVYVTDAAGRVLLDTDNDRDLGADYSRWRDVRLTLRGEYGARSTEGDPLYRDGSIMYVAAPVLHGEEIVGVVSIGKPTRNAERFLARTVDELSRAGLLVGAAAILIGLVMHWWLGRPLQQLVNYARDVSAGERAALPRLGANEVGRVGQAMEEMRVALDGKRYVSDYVQALTHELKSPIAAIRGAAELLGEDMAPHDRARFTGNIRNEVERMQELIDRLLELAALESRPSLEQVAPVAVHELLQDVVEAMRVVALQHDVRLQLDAVGELWVSGDAFLLDKALTNLVKNAIEFSPPGSRVLILAGQDGAQVRVRVQDHGSGIPDYARERVFDRFYALPKLDGRKGSGLGLSFVKEIAALLHAELRLQSTAGEGTVAELRLPACGTKT